MHIYPCAEAAQPTLRWVPNVHVLKGTMHYGRLQSWRGRQQQLAPLAAVTPLHKRSHVLMQTTPMEILAHVCNRLLNTSMAQGIMHAANQIPTILNRRARQPTGLLLTT
jgi:hypothetical protein